MNLSRMVQLMGLVTVVALIYINMQMQILELAYEGKQREDDIVSLQEENAVVSYQIMKLTSSQNLGRKLLAGDSGLKFRDRDSVIQLAAGSPAEPVRQVRSRRANPLLSFLALRAPAAEARQESTK